MTYKRFYKLFNRLPLHDRRIAGKEFGALTLPELDVLALKLRAIQRSGGLNPRPERPTGQAEQPRPQIIYMPLGGLPN